MRGLDRRQQRAGGARPRRFLLQQQCAPGFFRLNFTTGKTAATRPATAAKAPARRHRRHGVAVLSCRRPARASRRSRAALEGRRRGSRPSSARAAPSAAAPRTEAPNTNSTGLAGWALGLRVAAVREGRRDLGRRPPARREPSGSALIGERGAIAYDKAGLKAGRQDGITPEAEDQWRRATAQAAPALLVPARLLSAGAASRRTPHRRGPVDRGGGARPVRLRRTPPTCGTASGVTVVVDFHQLGGASRALRRRRRGPSTPRPSSPTSATP